MGFWYVAWAYLELPGSSDPFTWDYRNKQPHLDFYILIFYTEILVNSLINLKSLLSGCIQYDAITRGERFTFFLLIKMSFTSLVCLIAFARTCSTMLKRSGKSNIVILLLILEKIFHSFTNKYDIFFQCGYFINSFCQVEKIILFQVYWMFF